MDNTVKSVIVISAVALIVLSVIAVGYFVNSVYGNYGLYGSPSQGITGKGVNYPQSGPYGSYGNQVPNNNYGSYGGYGNNGPYTNYGPGGAYGGGMMGRGMMGGFGWGW